MRIIKEETKVVASSHVEKLHKHPNNEILKPLDNQDLQRNRIKPFELL